MVPHAFHSIKESVRECKKGVHITPHKPTPSDFKYKQNLPFRFIHLMMYVVHVVHNMDHIHH